MQFREVIGQEDVKTRIIRQYRDGRGPHALLLEGPEGCGKLAMAVALGSYLLCSHPGETDSCGVCPACKQTRKFSHPDLHFSFPIIRKSESTTCDDYMQEWTSMMQEGLYFGLADWLDRMGTDNKQAVIPDAEGDNILSKLSVTSYSGGYKVMIVWLPERMTGNAANNLLKFLEEPTPHTVFILVSDNAGQLLPTVLSRTQRIGMSRLPVEVVAQALQTQNGLEPAVARQVAHISNGSYLSALRYINIDNATDMFFDRFVSLMRLAYARDVRGLQQWGDGIASWGRERQKMFLGYMQNLLRENFIYNFHRPELNYMTDKEAGFATKFARFINERNIVDFVDETAKTQRDIEQNVNGKTVFFDFALNVTVLIRR